VAGSISFQSERRHQAEQQTQRRSARDRKGRIAKRLQRGVSRTRAAQPWRCHVNGRHYLAETLNPRYVPELIPMRIKSVGSNAGIASFVTTSETKTIPSISVQTTIWKR